MTAFHIWFLVAAMLLLGDAMVLVIVASIKYPPR